MNGTPRAQLWSAWVKASGGRFDVRVFLEEKTILIRDRCIALITQILSLRLTCTGDIHRTVFPNFNYDSSVSFDSLSIEVVRFNGTSFHANSRYGKLIFQQLSPGTRNSLGFRVERKIGRRRNSLDGVLK